MVMESARLLAVVLWLRCRLPLLHLPLLTRVLLLHLLGLLRVTLFHLLFLRVVVVLCRRLLMFFFLLLLQLLVVLLLLGCQLVLLLLILSISRGVAGIGCRHRVRLQLAGVSSIIFCARTTAVLRLSPVLACRIGRSRLVFAPCRPGRYSVGFEVGGSCRRRDWRLAMVGRSPQFRITACCLKMLVLRGYRRDVPLVGILLLLRR